MMSLSANQWTEKAKFPKGYSDYSSPSCVVWETEETGEKEIYCLGAIDKSLMVYNAERDEWREGETFFTYFL